MICFKLQNRTLNFRNIFFNFIYCCGVRCFYVFNLGIDLCILCFKRCNFGIEAFGYRGAEGFKLINSIFKLSNLCGVCRFVCGNGICICLVRSLKKREIFIIRLCKSGKVACCFFQFLSKRRKRRLIFRSESCELVFIFGILGLQS